MKNRFFSEMTIISLTIAIAPCLYAEDARPGPKYLNLRYDEDFSYLAGAADSYEKDLWDRLKLIELSDDWTLTLGGQARLRFESETYKSFGATKPTQDTFLLQRYFVHGDFRHSDMLRFFVQGKFAHVNDRDRGGLAAFEDHADIHQAFADITTSIYNQDITFRLGRQELQYGAERLISPLDWGNVRRTFEGVKLIMDTPVGQVDVFAVRPVVNDRRNLDDGNENIDFYGLYNTSMTDTGLGRDLYFLILKNNDLAGNSNGRTGRRTLYTLGGRLWKKSGNWDWEAEGATQFGTFAGDRVRAWMATLGGGYTFDDIAWKPRLGLLYDYASGDSDPTDGVHSTFNQHFPLGHAWLGYLDLVGRQNIHAIKAQLKVKPTKKITAWADFHTFFVDQDHDALYSAGGGRVRPGAFSTANAGSHKVGHELDLTMKYVVDKHITALIGWAHMWPGGFISRTGSEDSPDLIYTQVEYKF